MNVQIWVVSFQLRERVKWLKFLMKQRIGEFKNFIDNNEFSEMEANKFFSNDEAFMCNMIKNNMLYSIDIVAEKIAKNTFQ